jgi:hypothetical protein
MDFSDPPFTPHRNMPAKWFVATAGIVLGIHLAEVAILTKPENVDWLWDMPAFSITALLWFWCGLPSAAIYPVQFTLSALFWGTVGACFGALYEVARKLLVQT